MNSQRISAELAHLASTPGVRVCALVDSRTGMVWLSEGRQERSESMVEAARDYWNVNQRRAAAFAALGPVQGIQIVHENAVVHLTECGVDLLLVTVADQQRVNFGGWWGRLFLLRSLLR